MSSSNHKNCVWTHWSPVFLVISILVSWCCQKRTCRQNYCQTVILTGNKLQNFFTDTLTLKAHAIYVCIYVYKLCSFSYYIDIQGIIAATQLPSLNAKIYLQCTYHAYFRSTGEKNNLGNHKFQPICATRYNDMIATMTIGKESDLSLLSIGPLIMQTTQLLQWRCIKTLHKDMCSGLFSSRWWLQQHIPKCAHAHSKRLIWFSQMCLILSIYRIETQTTTFHYQTVQQKPAN